MAQGRLPFQFEVDKDEKKLTAVSGILIYLDLMLALGWLLATPSGARFALARAQGFVPGELTIGRVDGTLLGTLEVTGLDYAYGETRAAVGRLSVQVAPGELYNTAKQREETIDIEITEENST